MRGNPFDELEELMDRIGRQVEEGMGAGGLQMPGGVPVDVVDAGEEFEVTAELPGYETDDIELTLSEGTLRLEASSTAETSYTEGEYLRRERSQKATSRRIRLPEPVDEEAVSAGYEQGVLTVRLPKLHGDDESKSIDIE